MGITLAIRIAQQPCVTNFPVLASHSFTDLSNEALAMNRPSGEKLTSMISCWWPATGTISATCKY